jgi:hypothetical protein
LDPGPSRGSYPKFVNFAQNSREKIHGAGHERQCCFATEARNPFLFRSGRASRNRNCTGPQKYIPGPAEVLKRRKEGEENLRGEKRENNWRKGKTDKIGKIGKIAKIEKIRRSEK